MNQRPNSLHFSAPSFPLNLLFTIVERRDCLSGQILASLDCDISFSSWMTAVLTLSTVHMSGLVGMLRHGAGGVTKLQLGIKVELPSVTLWKVLAP